MQNRRTDRRTDRGTDELTDRRTDGPTDRRNDGSTDRWIYGDARINGAMDIQVFSVEFRSPTDSRQSPVLPVAGRRFLIAAC